MKVKKLVGKRVVANAVAEGLNMPVGTAFKVVGYVLGMNWAIVDAGSNGWKNLKPSDVIVEQCETYWLVYPGNITEIL
ncbi:hypothetical protein BS162P3_00038 [Bacteroides phage BS162P3]|nr:hypothetical protein BS162P3_00038 [Bacteroides phage BS162P3]